MASRDSLLTLTLGLLAACADFSGGPGGFGENVDSRENWRTTLDASHPTDAFRIRLETNSTKPTSLKSSDLALLVRLDATGSPQVTVDFSVGDTHLGMLSLSGSAADFTDAGEVKLDHVAPLDLEICTTLNLSGRGSMDIVVNTAEYRWKVSNGEDIDATIEILSLGCR